MKLSPVAAVVILLTIPGCLAFGDTEPPACDRMDFRTEPRAQGDPINRSLITGQVLTRRWQEISGANITARNGSGTFSTESHAGGCYGFILDSGAWEITVSKPGYSSQTRNIEVFEHHREGLDFFLKQS